MFRTFLANKWLQAINELFIYRNKFNILLFCYTRCTLENLYNLKERKIQQTFRYDDISKENELNFAYLISSENAENSNTEY